MRSWSVLLAAVFAAALATPTRASADNIVAGLEQPTYSWNNTATMGVTFLFSGNPGNTMEAFQLSVIGSDPLLTLSGTDYSRFSFTPNTSLLSGWAGTPTTFGSDGFVFYSTFGNGLPPSESPYQLGTLTVDLAGLSPNSPLTVTLNGQDPLFSTFAAGMIGGDFDLIPVDASGATVMVTPVPEPGSALLLATGVGFAVLRLRRRRPAPEAGS